MLFDGYSGATRVIFIVGDPIAQVKSPRGVTEALRRRGYDAVVVPAHVRPGDIEGFIAMTERMPNVDGLIVTVPHKLDAALAARHVSARARSIGAANVLRRVAADGTWQADMCDGEAFVVGLRRAGFDPRGRRALLVGAGGVGRAIAHALADAGVTSLALHDADQTRAEALAARLRTYRADMTVTVGPPDPTDVDLAANATPMGMRADDALPIDIDRLAPSTFVGDVVTMPEVPPLIAAARTRGARTMTGSSMFEAVRGLIVEYFVPRP